MQPNTYKEERELDARIAEKVLHAKVEWEKNTPYIVKDDQKTLTNDNIVPNYCTSIGPAMALAMELRRQGFKIDILMDEQGIAVTAWDKDGNEIMKHENIISKFAWYICHIALIAVGEERRRGPDRRKEAY